jgi:hypothetical protein
VRNSNYFGGRELKPYAEPIDAKSLELGKFYFLLNFADPGMLVPCMYTVVFIGRNLQQGDDDSHYFQSVDSFQLGTTFASRNKQSADFQVYRSNEMKHIFEFEKALDGLLKCALRRQK